ncbi:MAG: hypothetical protein COC19_00130 [SAR86 cluster bacterium]|uniref:Uncharacterized protein n=1 Tax=SAR86 cluster bacterium TaxID=2030880 RepID=A0A2A4MW22_9GAMM|nr:MAG: hypothetical protein COC19_00130 [SAR86 cluster bacterium]
MIFSLLKIPKKTANVLASLAIGAACLWGVSMWQDISREELISILLSTLMFIAVLMLMALTLIALLKFVLFAVKKIAAKLNTTADDQAPKQ